jgi:hypothetical protein
MILISLHLGSDLGIFGRDRKLRISVSIVQIYSIGSSNKDINRVSFLPSAIVTKQSQ